MTASPPPQAPPDVALQQAVAHHRAGRLAEAEQLYRAILQAQPYQPDANHNLGVLAGQVGQHAAGLHFLKTALVVNPSHKQYVLSYAEALLATDQPEETLGILHTARQHGCHSTAMRSLQHKAEVLLQKHSALGGKPSAAEMSRLIALFVGGHHVDLENLARILVERHPDFGAAWKALGISLQVQGKEALPALRKAVELSPGDAEALNNLGNALQTLGRFDDALDSLYRALALNPEFAEAHNNLGNVLRELGQLDGAAASYTQALAIRPDFAEVHNNLGNVLRELGQPDGAVMSYLRALEIKPNFADAHNNLGNALTVLRQHDDAIASYRQALEIKPDYVEAHNNLGIALKNLGQLDGAVASYARALEHKPDYVEAHNNLGNALRELGHPDSAVMSYLQALQIKPNFSEAHNNLGNALTDLGQHDDAVASYRRALEHKPDYVEAHNNLGNALGNLGQHDNAVASYRRALEINPDYPDAHSNLLFCLSHSETQDAATLFVEHCRFAERFEAPLRPTWPQHTNVRDPQRRLQVGLVSPDLRNHAVANFIEPVLAHLAAYPGLALHAYYNHTIEDPITQRLKSLLPNWHGVAHLSDEALAQKIRDDGIDILFDLSGHTAGNRLLTFARKPAPVQATWIGYPNTTGLQAMDYVLMDRFNSPHGLYERYYVEKPARLPSSGTFLPVAEAPPPNALPALASGRLTFGSFNRPSKLNDAVIALWSEVLRAVPGSRLMLGNVGEASLQASLTARFARCGVAAQRLIFQPRMAMEAYLALHHQVDFMLDTFPYTGGTTTNHALWMGVPVLTLSGPSARQCQCAGVLRRVGLNEWIADTPEDFLRRAVEWAGRLDELAQLRAGMRERLRSSPLRQPETVARGLEAALRKMWRRWCAGLPTEALEVTLEELDSASPGISQPPAESP